FFSSRRRHTRFDCDWSSDVCSSDLRSSAPASMIRARTRAQIIEAGALLLAERPLEALTVDAVVEAAGVAKGTFYYHFQSMEELRSEERRVGKECGRQWGTK